MLKIPMYDANDFVLSVTLDGKVWRLHFSWNDRAALWSMEIRNSSDVTLISGIRCVPNYPLINQYRRPTLPPGEFICTVLDDSYTSIGRDDFVNGKATLTYVTEVEFNAAI
nr:hypothetical protein [uncultured Anaeromusa sp.]